MTLCVLIPTWHPERARALIDKLATTKVLADTTFICSTERCGALDSMERLGRATDADYMMFIHDDIEILEAGWDQTIARFFEEHPKCGLAGFGGALGLGNPEIYKVPYQLQQLARHNFFSNMKEAHIHGFRTLKPMRVAVLDGFCLIFRREAYLCMGGWLKAINCGLMFHNYDFWACCMMARLGGEVWVIPIQCHHYGGGTSVSLEYNEWIKTQGYVSDVEVHARAHEICYREFKDVLPLRVE